MAWLYQRPDSEVWWIGYRTNGKQFLRSTGHRDKADAEKILATHEAMEAAKRAGCLNEEFFRTLTGSTIKALSLKAELAEWLKSCEGTTSENTQDRYKNIVRHFETFSNATNDKPLLRDITKAHFEAFIRSLSKSHSAGTANLARKTMAIFFNRAVADGKITINPTKGTKPVKTPKATKVKRRAFTLAELQKLWTQAPNDFWRYMLSGGFYTGLRLGDLICLHRGEIDLPNNRLKLEAAKVGNDIEIPLAPAFRKLIERRLKELPEAASYLWPDQEKLYRKQHSGPFSNEFYEVILQPCGLVPPRVNKKKKQDGRGRDARRNVNPVSYHSLRHTFISQLKASGAHQSVVKELAGHSSDAVNDLYTHVPIELMSAAIAKLPEVAK